MVEDGEGDDLEGVTLGAVGDDLEGDDLEEGEQVVGGKLQNTKVNTLPLTNSVSEL